VPNNYYTNASKKRLMDEYIIPGYLAFGEVISSDSGKAIFRVLYEERRSLRKHEERKNLAYRDYATRRQELMAENYAGCWARVSTYRECFALLMAETGLVTKDTACRIINNELAELLSSDSDDDFYNAGIRKGLNSLCSDSIHRLTYR